MLTEGEILCIRQQIKLENADWSQDYCTPEVLELMEWRKRQPIPDDGQLRGAALLESLKHPQPIPVPVFEEPPINWWHVGAYFVLGIGAVLSAFLAYKLIKLMAKLYKKLERWSEK
jgi:hypothetical protein